MNGISDFPSGCNSCHDTPPMSGEHLEHLHEGISCSKCHAGYTKTTENPTLHRNARQDVTLSGWNASRRTCSNLSCHGSEYWGRTGEAARQSCNQCHGVPPRSGEHFEHSEYACSRCHGTGYSTTTTNAATHMNSVADVPFAFYNRTTRTCSSTGCHGSEQWGTPSPVTPNCANCHGFPPPLPHPQQSACQTCHSSMLPSGVLTDAHNNGTLDISGAGCATCHGSPPATTRNGGLHPTDANCYGCHSTTVGPDNQVSPNGTHNDGYVQVGGGGVGTYGCQTCHGDPQRAVPAGTDPHAKSAPPRGTRGESEPTTRAVGAHLAHVAKGPGAIARAAACAECHLVPTAMDHATGVVVMAFGGRAAVDGAAPLWNGASLTCSSTYCHGATLAAGGTNTAPSWVGGPAESACGTCHGAPPPAPHTANTSCGACHDGYTATTVNVADHVDGNVDVSPSTCNACHGSAANAAPPSGAHGETLTTQRAVGAHQAHLAGGPLANALACSDCHVRPELDGARRRDRERRLRPHRGRRLRVVQSRDPHLLHPLPRRDARGGRHEQRPALDEGGRHAGRVRHLPRAAAAASAQREPELRELPRRLHRDERQPRRPRERGRRGRLARVQQLPRQRGERRAAARRGRRHRDHDDRRRRAPAAPHRRDRLRPHRLLRVPPRADRDGPRRRRGAGRVRRHRHGRRGDAGVGLRDGDLFLELLPRPVRRR